jgi:hypothetical protein
MPQIRVRRVIEYIGDESTVRAAMKNKLPVGRINRHAGIVERVTSYAEMPVEGESSFSEEPLEAENGA